MPLQGAWLSHLGLSTSSSGSCLSVVQVCLIPQLAQSYSWIECIFGMLRLERQQDREGPTS